MIDLVNETDPLPAAAPVFVKVTNRNNRFIKDRFDGVPFTFKPNEPVSITQAQAQHFFGYPQDIEGRALHMAKRYGWNTPEYVLREPGAGPDAPMLFQVYAANIILEDEEYEWRKKGADNLADDGVDIDSMPTMEATGRAPRPDQPAGELDTKVGRRKGSPVKLGRRRKAAEPPSAPGFVPLG